MNTIISVVNVANRAGKTTTAVNLAVEFSQRGHKTLLIDADPQAHATPFFMNDNQIVWTLADTLCPQQSGARHKFAHWDVFSPSLFDNLFVVPSGIRLATFEGIEPSHVHDLTTSLTTIEHLYDLIVIDTAPSLSLLTQACLHASTHVLAPVSPGGQSTAGLGLLSEYMGNMPCVMRPSLLGVVCNRFDCRSRESGTFYEELKEEWGELLCETIIHRDDAIEQSAERHETLLGIGSGLSSAADLYMHLADEVLSRLDVIGSWHHSPVNMRTYD